jgi:predicted DNA-binding transcriptional regulator YafY
MAKQNMRTENQAARLAQQYGLSKRTVYRYVEFHNAVQTLADAYGQDILNCLLDRDRKVRLTHTEIKKLADAVSHDPRRFVDLGHVIRAGDTELVRYFLCEA